MRTSSRLFWFCAALPVALIGPGIVSGQENRAANMAVTKASLHATAAKVITKKDLVGDHRFTLKGWKGDLTEAKITDLAGNDIAGILAPQTVGEKTTMAQPTQPFVIKSRKPPLVALNAINETMLPGGLVVALSPAPDGGGAATAVWFRLFCSISPRPAPWDETESSYVTRMKFTVRPTEGSPPSLMLPSPVTVSLEFDGMTAREVPDFVITQAGLEHQKVVELRFRPSTLQPKLKVRSTISDSDLPIEALPRLELRPARTEWLGFGLETLPVAVAQIQPDGGAVVAPAPVNVDIQVEGVARREGAEAVIIPAGEARAGFVLRSSGLGKVVVRATAGSLTATTVLNQKFPTGPLIAALLGGALGGLARRWIKGARKRSSTRHMVEGVVVGAVAFVAGVLGVGYLHLPAAIVATEAGAFLSGVLCGFAGVAVLSAITDRAKAPGA